MSASAQSSCSFELCCLPSVTWKLENKLTLDTPDDILISLHFKSVTVSYPYILNLSQFHSKAKLSFAKLQTRMATLSCLLCTGSICKSFQTSKTGSTWHIVKRSHANPLDVRVSSCIDQIRSNKFSGKPKKKWFFVIIIRSVVSPNATLR